MNSAGRGPARLKFARSFGGYTVIEVFIVLAVSGALLFSAVAVFSGKQGQVQFNQAMQDLDSKIKKYANDVGVSVFPQAESYECLTSSDDRPYLRNLGGSTKVTGSNQNCIFLGRAIKVNPGTDTITAYTVLGNRSYDDSLCRSPVLANRTPVTSFSQTCPDLAVDAIGANQLAEQYDFPYKFGTLVKSWADNDNPANANQSHDLIGFYNSLQTSSVEGANGSQSLLVRAYRVVGNGQSVRNCIRDQNNSCNMTEPKKWTMCFKSDNGRETATLAVISSPAGVTTDLQIKPDPAVCS